MRSTISDVSPPIEMAVTTADDLVPWAQCGQATRRALGDAWLGSEQEDAVAMLRPPQIVGDEIGSIEIFRKRRPVEDPARDVDANAVVEDERILQRQAESRVLGGDIQRMGVGEGDSDGFALLVARIDQPHGFVEGLHLNRNVEDCSHRCPGGTHRKAWRSPGRHAANRRMRLHACTPRVAPHSPEAILSKFCSRERAAMSGAE